jgi:hypothetical protein
VLGVELLGILISEFGHFDITDGEPIFFYDIDDFADIHIGIWFDHCKGSKIYEMLLALLFFEFVLGEQVSKINDFKLTGEDA